MLKRNTLKGAIAVFILALALPLQALAFSQLFGFGDSLSDSRNNADLLGATSTPPYPSGGFGEPFIPTFPYASERYSNGPVWIEYFGSLLGLPLSASVDGGTNFAYGGSRSGPLPGVAAATPDLLTQVAFATGGGLIPLPSDALYAVWTGSNDIREAAALVAAGNVLGALAVLSAGPANIAQAITDLASAGAEQFVVLNVPDIGIAPFTQYLDGLPGLAGTAAATTAAVQSYNDAVAALVPGLEGGLGIDIILVDIFSFLQNAVNNPLPGANVTDACTSANLGNGCAAPGNYLFWDGIHPTTAAHELTANFVHAHVVPLPLPVVLLASALGVLGLRLRPIALTR